MILYTDDEFLCPVPNLQHYNHYRLDILWFEIIIFRDNKRFTADLLAHQL